MSRGKDLRQAEEILVKNGAFDQARAVRDLLLERDTAWACIDAMETTLFGDNRQRSRDELETQVDGLRKALLPFITTCREWVGDNRCVVRAEFILWGKLLPPNALGPRCYDHAAQHVGHQALGDPQWAIFDLRPLLRIIEPNCANGGTSCRECPGCTNTALGCSC